MNGLLTTTEAAAILKIHVNTLYGYLESRRLRGYKVIGNRWRIKAQDLEAFINEQGAGLDDTGANNKESGMVTCSTPCTVQGG